MTAPVEGAVLGALADRPGEVAPGALVARTGLPRAQVDAALRSLALRFRCSLRVTDTGEIRYDFGEGLRARMTARDRLGEAGLRLRNGAARGVLVLFRLGLAGVLVVYGLFYACLLVALTARLDRAFATRTLRKVVRFAVDLLRASPRRRPPGGWQPGDGLEALRARVKAWDFPERLSCFVFGVAPAFPTARDRDRAHLARALAQGGWTAACDRVRLFGEPARRAREECARLYAAWGADVRVGPSGTVLYDLRGLVAGTSVAASSAAASEDAALQGGLAAREAAAWAVGRDRGTALLVLGGVALNLAGAAALAWALPLTEYGSSALAWGLVVGFPAAFTGAVVLAGACVRAAGARSRARRRLLAAVVDRAVDRDLGIPADPGDAAACLAERIPGIPGRAGVRRLLPAILAGLGGELAAGPDPATPAEWRIPILADEARDLEAMRASEPPLDPGRVVWEAPQAGEGPPKSEI